VANLKFNNTLRSNRMDEITSFCGTSAVIKLYTGTQPAGGGTATTLLVTLTCDAAAFAGSSTNGSLTLNAVTGATAVATGTARWFRIETSGGTWCIDGDITTTAVNTGDMLLDDTAIVLNGSVSLSGPNTLLDGNAP
jgi:hypothetical protein